MSTDETPMTLFALPDNAVVNHLGNFSEYPSFFLRHIVPCKLLWNDLVDFRDGFSVNAQDCNDRRSVSTLCRRGLKLTAGVPSSAFTTLIVQADSMDLKSWVPAFRQGRDELFDEMAERDVISSKRSASWFSRSPEPKDSPPPTNTRNRSPTPDEDSPERRGEASLDNGRR
ncbi:hypothetical protein K1719_001721 [Acacia pycnantha]|nr:hypothetical protein K1719_001721 [Acacia pycnantha]